MSSANRDILTAETKVFKEGDRLCLF
jgi:hypothetical protein